MNPNPQRNPRFMGEVSAQAGQNELREQTRTSAPGNALETPGFQTWNILVEPLLAKKIAESDPNSP